MRRLTPGGVRILAWTAGVVLAGLQAWIGRERMNPDGVAYLDISDRVVGGDPGLAVHAYWSPAYPWLLGWARRCFAPQPADDFAAAHAVNFVLFMVAFGTFEVLLRQLARVDSVAGGAAWRAFAYALFLWATLRLITLSLVTPDLLVEALVFAVAALILSFLPGEPRAARGASTVPDPPRLGLVRAGAVGAVLGAAYLAKAALFPLAPAFLGALAATATHPRAALLRFAAGFGVFLAVALPYATAVTTAVGRPTFGETGRLNYAWYVSGQRHPAPGVLTHPVRRVAVRPAAYTFAGPVAGTYPKWYDPSYWYAGVPVALDVRAQVRVLVGHLAYYARLLWPYLLLVGVVRGFGLAAGPRNEIDDNRPASGVTRRLTLCLVGPALAALLMYALVHVEGRFLGGFVPLLVLGALAGARTPATVSRAHAAAGVATLLAAACVAAANGGAAIARDVQLSTGLVAAVVYASTRRTMPTGSRRVTAGAGIVLAAVAVGGAALGATPGALAAIVAGLWGLVLYGRPAAARERETDRGRALPGRGVVAAALAAGAIFACLSGARVAGSGLALVSPRPHGAAPVSPLAVATALRAAGVRPGMRVATVGTGDDAYWARLLRVQIVAEVPTDAVAAFWAVAPAERAPIWRAFAEAGVAVAVAANPPQIVLEGGHESPGRAREATERWRTIGGGGGAMLALR